MPVKIACPNCQAGLSMPEAMFGKQVRCPKCQKPFQCPTGPEEEVKKAPRPVAAPAPAAKGGGNPFDFVEAPAAPSRDSAAEVEFEPDDEDVLSRRQPRGGWNGVASGGLFLVISGGVYLLFYLILYFIGHAKGPPSPGMAKTIFTLLCLTFLGACALGALGLWKCTAVPDNSGARGAAYSGAVCMSIATLTTSGFVMLFLIAMFGGKPPAPAGEEGATIIFYVFLIAIGTLVASFVLCIFFLTIVASHLKSRAMLTSVVAYGVFLMVSPIVFLAMSVLAAKLGIQPISRPDPSGLPGNEGPSITGTLSLMMTIGWVAWFIVNVLMINAAVARARRMGRI